MTLFMIQVAPVIATYSFFLTGVASIYYKNVYIKIVYNYFVNIKLKVEINRVPSSEFTTTYVSFPFTSTCMFIYTCNITAIYCYLSTSSSTSIYLFL